MTKLMKKFSVGDYFIIAAIITGLIGLIKFVSWAGAHGAMDYLVIAGFVLALVLDVVLLHIENSYFCVLATVGYSLALFKLLADSVGTFVDLFQGINMFGDVSQMGNIVNISIFAAISAVLSVVISFMPLKKTCEA